MHRLGGDCTWTRYVPSKALLERARDVQAARRVGWHGEPDVGHIMAGVAETVRRIARDEDANTLERHDITILQGRGRGRSRTVGVNGEPIAAATVIIATGAAPYVRGTGKRRPR